jgi:uncharacterized protein (TIGR02391 family)
MHEVEMKTAAWVYSELLRLQDDLANWEPPHYLEKAEEYAARLNQLLPHVRSLGDDFVHEELQDGFPPFRACGGVSPSGESITDDAYSALRGVVMLLRWNFFDNERLNALHPRVWKTVISYFRTDHMGSAVLEAFKDINNRVKELVGLQGADKDGTALMARAFLGNTPILRLNDGTTRSEEDEQVGFGHIFMGAMQGIRNPKAHDLMAPVDEDRALEYLTLASLLMHRLDDAEKRLKAGMQPNGS